jgi:hypothetical protein
MLIMGLTILVMILVTIVLAARLTSRSTVASASAPMPARPWAFGEGMCWLAVRTRDTDGVVAALGLHGAGSSTWDHGLGAVSGLYEAHGRIFVSPPVNGWTLVVGLALPQPMGPAFVDKAMPLLEDLGERFVEVQYFLAYPVLDYFAWARVLDGRLQRAYAVTDDGNVWDEGRTTREEKALGIRFYEMRGIRRREGDAGGELVLHPTAAHVSGLAAQWSLDPTRLAGMPPPAGAGVLGRAPRAWRPERLRRRA